MTTTKSINFNAEHKSKLDVLLLKHLYSNTLIDGLAGTKVNIYQLLHETSLKSLQSVHQNLFKTVDAQKNIDQWSMTDYQQEKQEKLKEVLDLVNLMIGFKKSEALKETNRDLASKLRSELKALKESNKTPEERIKELDDQIKSIEGEI